MATPSARRGNYWDRTGWVHHDFVKTLEIGYYAHFRAQIFVHGHHSMKELSTIMGVSTRMAARAHKIYQFMAWSGYLPRYFTNTDFLSARVPSLPVPGHLYSVIPRMIECPGSDEYQRWLEENITNYGISLLRSTVDKHYVCTDGSRKALELNTTGEFWK